MAQPVQFTIPVHSDWVPAYLENILDKRIAGAALSALEKFVDILCRVLYLPYNILFEQKLSRIHLFSDGQARLIDCTARGIAAIEVEKTQDLISGRLIGQIDRITLDKKPIYFSGNQEIQLTFSRNTFTDYVVVKDAVDERIEIIEQETHRGAENPAVKTWVVDLKKANDLVVQFGNIPQVMGKFYLVENPVDMEEGFCGENGGVIPDSALRKDDVA